MKLTGRTRYRSNWRGKLILQVEYSQHHVKDLNGSGYYDDWDTLHWRDARPEDLINKPQPQPEPEAAAPAGFAP